MKPSNTDEAFDNCPYVPDFLQPPVGDPARDVRGAGARWNDGKAPLDFIPTHLLDGASRVFKKVTERPVNPYPKWNWAKGMPWSVPVACVKRHMAALERGELRDPETGELHADHMLCNVLMLVHYADAYPEGNDLPGRYFKPGGMDREKQHDTKTHSKQ